MASMALMPVSGRRAAHRVDRRTGDRAHRFAHGLGEAVDGGSVSVERPAEQLAADDGAGDVAGEHHGGAVGGQADRLIEHLDDGCLLAGIDHLAAPVGLPGEPDDHPLT
jgi:hypothetical protein